MLFINVYIFSDSKYSDISILLLSKGADFCKTKDKVYCWS